MKMALTTVLLCLEICFLYQTYGQTISNVKDLQTKLFTTDAYNKYVRPSADFKTPTRVYVDLILLGINGLDEVNSKLSTTGFLLISWVDVSLNWTSSDYGDLYYFYTSQSNIWKPILTLKNGFTKLKELGGSFLFAKIFDNGVVEWMPFEVFESSCTIDTKYFPFDTQKCTLEFVVWSQSLADVILAQGIKGILLNEYQNSTIWTILSTSTRTSQETAESIVYFTIEMKRKPLFFIINIILPIVLLTALDLLTFILPADSGEKMGYTVTVFLAFAVFLTTISETLPDSSNSIPLLSYYLVLQLFLQASITTVTSFELRLHTRDESQAIPNLGKSAVRFTRRLRCKKDQRGNMTIVAQNAVEPFSAKQNVNVVNVNVYNGNENNENSSVSPSSSEGTKHVEEDGIKWSDVTAAMDFIFFWFFSFMVVTSSLTLFMMAAFNL